MKKIAFLFLAMVAFGCSDDEKHDESWIEIEIPNPQISKMTLTEVCESVEDKVQDITRVNEFSFSEGWMTSHISSQEYTAEGKTTKIARESAFQYNSNHSLATLTDQSNNQYEYSLNEQGYATQCTYTSDYQKRQYTFSYANGYLTQLTEEVIPTDGIGETTISHKLILNYKNGDLISVVSPSLTGESFTGYGENQINYEAGKDINYYRLPCLLLLDTYPLSFHQEALFAGLLGKPTQHLTVRSFPEGVAENTEYTKYTYKFDSNGKPISIQTYTYYGGGTYQGAFPNTRKITIEIE